MAEAELKSRYSVQGMDCASCAKKIDTAVRRIDGVDDVNVSVARGTMTVSHRDAAAIQATIEKQVRKLGYSATLQAGAVPFEPAPAKVHDCSAHGHDHAAHDHDHGHEAGGSHNHDHAGHDHGAASEKPAASAHSHTHVAGEGPWWKQTRALLTFACGTAVVLAFLAAHAVPDFEQWFYGAAMLVGLVPIARRALAAATSGTPFSIEMLMTVAAIGAVMIGATEEAAAVVFLFLVGELLEGVAAGRARASIRGLSALVPKTARLEKAEGTYVEVPAETVSVGAVIMVRPGDRIAADGAVISGSSAVDEAPVTGESTPKAKEPGDMVFAGSVNGDGVLRIKVSAAAADNTIARIVRLVEEAQESKAPTERFIDRFSTFYTPAVMVLAMLVAVLPPLFAQGAWDEWIYKSLAILLIGCPCALVISTPAAIAASLSAGARRGLLMKGGAVLEGAGRLTAIAFDKTGTLTAGKPLVTDVISFSRSEPDILKLAAALETGSSHPLAVAILNKAVAEGVAVVAATDSAALGGRGVIGTVEGQSILLASPRAAGEKAVLSEEQKTRIAALNDEGKTVSILVVGNEVAGAIALRDEPRPDALAGLAALKALGIRPLMLTGDNKRTATAVGKALDIEVHAELMPQDKQRIVGELKAKGDTVGKVGDGINDAPALAAADVGIAMGGGTDVALETADAAILNGRVMDVAGMVDLSRRTLTNIHQNIGIALGLKVVFFVTTIIGVTGLWPAILADTGATVLVTANAMRLLGWKLKFS
ncbi:heavy metal translocating P-type ATPase [Oryzicola mucosus]|uniref:P-type Zn(2+) transporter n=1 Tax=Oryzicola mucosus TaxID=2767425 RepID=A0A8J6U102_9HYPH|nr:heavy metal translocating P-type ATPase [Oryzicola mucosus]MBD0416366.1 heavy metal translocating P-type ATPase [Oryzicola mucosus]